MEDKIICIFGDSTAWGAWDREMGGWANRLWLYVAEKYPDDMIYNLSVSGGTTKTILSRFESEAKIRKADVLIFQTGGNDASYWRKDKKTGTANTATIVPPEVFRKNIQEIIDRARKLIPQKTGVANIAFIGFKNCDEARTMPVSWIDICYTNENIKKYNAIMKEVCAANSVPFLDLYGLMENSDLEDGIHPNTSGHKKIFEKVRDFVEKEKVL